MQTSLHSVVKSIFHKNSLQELSEQQIQDYVHSYPYSSIGHILLARKKKEEGSGYQKEAALAALYVDNPLWLHCFLNEDLAFVAEINKSHVPGIPITAGEEVIDIFSKAPVPGPLTSESEEPVVMQAEQELSESKEVYESVAEYSSENLTSETRGSIDVAQPEEEIVERKGEAGSVEVGMSEKIPEEKELIFEPYHTIDYFASQGIKLKAGDFGNDKLGRQLKSFTEWLRSMKRVTPVQADDLPLENATDEAIQRNAEESVETSDVETEAMAEVWIKQGKAARAIAIYRKLSLLNPAKSHYFAAKIEQLND